MLAIVLAAALGQAAASQVLAAFDATRTAVSPPRVVVEIDGGTVKGEPVGLAWAAGLGGSFLVDAGPAVQAVAGQGGAVRMGGDGRMTLSRRFGDRVRIEAAARAERIAGAYQRIEGGLSAELLFP